MHLCKVYTYLYVDAATAGVVATRPLQAGQGRARHPCLGKEKSLLVSILKMSCHEQAHRPAQQGTCSLVLSYRSESLLRFQVCTVYQCLFKILWYPSPAKLEEACSTSRTNAMVRHTPDPPNNDSIGNLPLCMQKHYIHCREMVDCW